MRSMSNMNATVFNIEQEYLLLLTSDYPIGICLNWSSQDALQRFAERSGSFGYGRELIGILWAWQRNVLRILFPKWRRSIRDTHQQGTDFGVPMVRLHRNPTHMSLGLLGVLQMLVALNIGILAIGIIMLSNTNMLQVSGRCYLTRTSLPQSSAQTFNLLEGPVFNLPKHVRHCI